MIATTALAACLAVWGANPAAKVIQEQVDLIEINHFHDDQGRPVFDQILFYDWSPTDRRYQVRDWRLLKNSNQIPLRMVREGEYMAVWSDFKNNDALRETRAKLVRESWTQYDPELIEREFLPEGKRRKFRDANPSAKLLENVPAAAASPPAHTALRPIQLPLAR